MKQCTKCNTTKPENEFFKKRKTQTSWCKKCLHNYQARRWNRNKTLLIIEKGNECEECGYKGHPATFDFHHHGQSQKEFNISEMRCCSLIKLRKEIEKCQLLCAICHRLKHISADNWNFEFDQPKPQPRKRPICKCGKVCINGKKYCSPQCRIKSQETIIWPTDLPKLVHSSSKSAVARLLGVSDKAVAKRLQRHH